MMYVLSTNANTNFTYIEHDRFSMRPEISEELEDLINEVAEDHGFSSASEFVRYATRKYALELKDIE